MTTRLAWSDAIRSDGKELQTFVCTPPAEQSPAKVGPKVFPRPPEARAQKIVRGLNIPKSVRCHQRIWLGRDSAGIGAVASWKWTERDVAMVCVVALATRLRGNGSTYTDELVDTATAQVAGEAAERDLAEAYLEAYIHEENRASKAFAARFGMAAVSEPDLDGYVLHSVALAFAETG